MKVYNHYIGFREIPGEICLCLNISECPNACVGCHSPWLQTAEGRDIEEFPLESICNTTPVTCVAIMGGDAAQWSELYSVAERIRKTRSATAPQLKVAWYSGRDTWLPDFMYEMFDYVKLGHYDSVAGDLTQTTTNQRLYRQNEQHEFVDITSDFWRAHTTGGARERIEKILRKSLKQSN